MTQLTAGLGQIKPPALHSRETCRILRGGVQQFLAGRSCSRTHIQAERSATGEVDAFEVDTAIELFVIATRLMHTRWVQATYPPCDTVGAASQRFWVCNRVLFLFNPARSPW